MILHDATSHLRGLPDEAMILHDAADKLSELRDYVSALHDAADKLVNLPDHATYLEHVSETSERTISNSTTQLSEVVRRLEAVIADIPTPAQSAAPRSPAVPPTTITVPVKPEWYWKAMVAGWAGWACFALTMLIVWLNAKGN